MKRKKTARLGPLTLVLKGEEWIIRKDRKIVARNTEWVPMIRELKAKKLLPQDFK